VSVTITDDTLIRDLPLSKRIKHALYHGRRPHMPYFSYDRTFGEVKNLSDGTLLSTSGFGQTSLREWVRVRDEALGLAPAGSSTSRKVVTPFESLVRPLLGDAYDAAFPKRGTEPDASLNADEQSMVETLCELHTRATCIEDGEVRATARHALVLSMKALRRSAETRAKRERALAKRGTEPRYLFRATTPDGNVIEYPNRATKNINQRYVLLHRRVRRPIEQLEAIVRADYASRWARAMSDSYRNQLANEILNNIEAEIAEQEEADYTWRFYDTGDRPDLFEKKIRRHVNKPTDRWPHEFTMIEGIAFNINQGEDQ
jgi:hypothetical protein